MYTVREVAVHAKYAEAFGIAVSLQPQIQDVPTTPYFTPMRRPFSFDVIDGQELFVVVTATGTAVAAVCFEGCIL